MLFNKKNGIIKNYNFLKDTARECHLNGRSEKCTTYFIFNFANVIGKVINVYDFIYFIFSYILIQLNFLDIMESRFFISDNK